MLKNQKIEEDQLKNYYSILKNILKHINQIIWKNQLDEYESKVI